MFYSSELLSLKSNNPSIGVVWLASTLHSTALDKKSESATHECSNIIKKRLTRQDLNKVNVPEACQFICYQTPCPLSLRLQSNLMVGVARVYRQQVGLQYLHARALENRIRNNTTVIVNLDDKKRKSSDDGHSDNVKRKKHKIEQNNCSSTVSTFNELIANQILDDVMTFNEDTNFILPFDENQFSLMPNKRIKRHNQLFFDKNDRIVLSRTEMFAIDLLPEMEEKLADQENCFNKRSRQKVANVNPGLLLTELAFPIIDFYVPMSLSTWQTPSKQYDPMIYFNWHEDTDHLPSIEVARDAESVITKMPWSSIEGHHHLQQFSPPSLDEISPVREFSCPSHSQAVYHSNQWALDGILLQKKCTFDELLSNAISESKKQLDQNINSVLGRRSICARLFYSVLEAVNHSILTNISVIQDKPYFIIQLVKDQD